MSSSPTVIQDDVTIDLPAERDQINTRGEHRFAELRTRIYAEIRNASQAAAARPQEAGRAG